MGTPIYLDTIETAVDAVISAVGNHIVLGIPLGIGKPNRFVNALYRRVKENPAFRLKIITALSLERPVGKSDLEKRFLGPFVTRVFGDYPDLDYVADLHAGHLPPNIEICEFFLKTGEYLNNPIAQQHYIYSNYSHAARDMLLNGINVIAQAVAMHGEGDARRLSLSSNPDVTLDVLDMVAEQHRSVVTIAVVNNKLPFMPNDAEVPPGRFDYVVTDPAGTHDLFAPPNMKVSQTDYAIGLHASSLVLDGGTLQIGIGSLGDAIAHALIVRERDNDAYRQMLAELSAGRFAEGAELGRFAEGLYGASEMFVNGFLRLIDAGIVRREVFGDPCLQRLLNEGRIGQQVTPHTLQVLLEAGAIHAQLTGEDLVWLQRWGILQPEVKLVGDALVLGEQQQANRIDDPAARQALAQGFLGDRLRGGIFMHGGFFIGPRDFYQRLHEMPPERLAHICMSRIGYINQLYGHEEIAREQRRKARFINTTMMVTLLGAAVSDSLDSGQLVSGVGGQYNFVAMGHALPDARSILLLRATREHRGEISSNIVWNYAHTTIPRHLRDIVVTEYGVADLRGRSDADVVKRLLAVTDSRFQETLLDAAKENGKIEQSYEIPPEQRHNLPEHISATLGPWHERGLLPSYPFGSDFTPDEEAIIGALQRLKKSAEHPLDLVGQIVASLFEDKQVPEEYLERMGFDHVTSLKDKLLRRLFVGNF